MPGATSPGLATIVVTLSRRCLPQMPPYTAHPHHTRQSPCAGCVTKRLEPTAPMGSANPNPINGRTAPNARHGAVVSNLNRDWTGLIFFYLSFSFIFSQFTIISLQFPVERGDIASPFSYRKGGNQSAEVLLPYILKLRKKISLYDEKKETRKLIRWSCSSSSASGRQGVRFRLDRPRHESSEEDESKTKSARLPTCTLSVTLTQGVQGARGTFRFVF